MSIYLKTDIKFNSIKEIINYFYFKVVEGQSHIYKYTYSDLECKRLQCNRARRSFVDWLEICQTYFKEVDPNELAYELMYNTDITGYICPDIGRYVFRNYKTFRAENTIMRYNYIGRTYYGEDKEDKFGYSYNKLVEMADTYKQQLDEKS